MLDVIGIDSRKFSREKKIGEVIKSFKSVLGIAVRVLDYDDFDSKYSKILQDIFNKHKIKKKYKYYCYNDLKNNAKCWEIIKEFIEKIEPYIHKVHVFYSMFSSKKILYAKVYGRLSKQKKIKLSKPTRTYKELTSKHLVNTFPVICAWRLIELLNPTKTQFHLDSFSGHNFEAYENLTNSSFSKFVYTSGDCLNPVISMADLLVALLDYNLKENNLLLTFNNIRPSLNCFGEKVLAYPISNKHLPKITPLEKKAITPFHSLKRPVYWLFKGDDLMHSGVLKRSETYRNFLDAIAYRGGCIKLFSKADAENIQNGDYGVYLDSQGEEIINSYLKIGKKLIKEKLDLYVKKEG